VTLTPGTWIVQPSGYVTVTLSGALPAAGSDSFSGTVGGGGSACTTFDLHRASAIASTDAQCSVADLISKHEGGFQPHVYNDTADPTNPTVGIGFNLNRPDAATALSGVGADYAKVRTGTADLNEQQANTLFGPDVATARSQAASYFSDIAALVPARQDVLIDMAFNIKPATFLDFTKFHDALVAGDYATASMEMLNSKWARQTKTRAVEDAAMMMTGHFQPGRCSTSG
jgi:GH24 family phage-related lysozyme (muramidase)